MGEKQSPMSKDEMDPDEVAGRRSPGWQLQAFNCDNCRNCCMVGVVLVRQFSLLAKEI